MKEYRLIVVGDNYTFTVPHRLGGLHIDDYKKASELFSISINLNNDHSAGLTTAENGYLNIINAKDAILIYVPKLDILSDVQLQYLLNYKETLYQLEQDGVILECAIITDKEVLCNHKRKYRDLEIEQKIARIEGNNISSILDILYNDLDKQIEERKNKGKSI